MITEAMLRQMYLDEQLSIRQTAVQCGVSDGTIRYYMKRYGIPRRTKSESLSGTKNPMYGKPKSEEARKKTSATLRVTNASPAVRAKRSAATAGSRNPMAGRTHTDVSRQAMSLKQAARCSAPEIRASLAQQARDEWAVPEIREALTAKAKLKVGAKNSFFGKQHTDHTKGKIAKANQGRFLGSNGPNWQGGKTRLSALIRNSEAATRWRRAIFERDAFTCKKCGTVGGPLHADHIRPLALLLDEHKVTTLEDAFTCSALWDLSNGRTLCISCHKQTDSYAGAYQKNYRKS